MRDLPQQADPHRLLNQVGQLLDNEAAVVKVLVLGEAHSEVMMSWIAIARRTPSSTVSVAPRSHPLNERQSGGAPTSRTPRSRVVRLTALECACRQLAALCSLVTLAGPPVAVPARSTPMSMPESP